MGVIDILTGIVVIIVLIAVIVLVMVVIILREKRAQRKADDDHELIQDEIKDGNNCNTNSINGINNTTGINTGYVVNPYNNAAINNTCIKGCGCICSVACIHDKHLKFNNDNHHNNSDSSNSSDLSTYETPCSKFRDSSSSDSSSSDSSSSDSSSSNGWSHSPSSSSSDSSSDSSNGTWSTITVGSSASGSNCECSRCRIPKAPVLNCTGYSQGTLGSQCGIIGQSGGSFFIQWFPDATDARFPSTQYTVYIRGGNVPVTTSIYDYRYFISGNNYSFTTPSLPDNDYTFMVTVTNECGESDPSAIFAFTRG